MGGRRTEAGRAAVHAAGNAEAIAVRRRAVTLARAGDVRAEGVAVGVEAGQIAQAAALCTASGVTVAGSHAETKRGGTRRLGFPLRTV